MNCTAVGIPIATFVYSIEAIIIITNCSEAIAVGANRIITTRNFDSFVIKLPTELHSFVAEIN